ncbi:hypothetical protein GT037_004182 [Alternaria burnsii]|uniref:CHCH domain-containing protein n=2 Tax=Alternaria sect. Alternaria TaxID=2499237 RepID=A0A8H7B4I7_9PLEO|nr:uncharacterized protein GT037_004182 [Alternaria burnsii]KAB2107301.1 hypothetical protein AG0111_0g3670 [Alternaria gaisen]KAF7677323.1 hypothetical protein GT037_004182 [Alternaria burnsii]CAI9634584.1 unnamed protein product [Alternaria burnsii]
MPRQRSGTAPPRRPQVPAAKQATTAPAPASSRPHSTAAAPPRAPASAHAPPQQQAQAPTPQGPGLFGQMASTAAGVAVGSSIGHAVGGWFGGGSSAPAEASPQNTEFSAQHQPANAASAQMAQSGPCANDVQSFRKCMDENQGSLTICGWYLDQLKACQAAAGQY